MRIHSRLAIGLNLALPLVLAGCGREAASPPAIEVHTVTKTVEVQKPCIAEGDLATLFAERPAKLARPLPSDASQLSAMVTLKLDEYLKPGAYVDRLEAMLRLCSKGAQPTTPKGPDQ